MVKCELLLLVLMTGKLGWNPIITSSAFTSLPNPPKKAGQYLQNLEEGKVKTRGKPRSRYSQSWSSTRNKAEYKKVVIDYELVTKTAKKNSKKSFEVKFSEKGNFWLESSPLNFTCIGGYTDVKDELNQVIEFMKNPDKYKPYNVRLPKGILLYGPPGTGKTLLAKCIAGEAQLPFIATSGSLFQYKYIGIGSERIRELFEFARKVSPCMIFIDELDAVARHRSADTEVSSAERDQTLNQLLVEMDGFVPTERVIVIAATNRLDIIDPALRRPGRLDRAIQVNYPDEDGRQEIINIHVKGKPVNASIETLTDITAGMSGAEIEWVLNEAVLRAIRYDTLPVNVTQLENIYEERLVGRSTTKFTPSKEFQWRIAIHESGHALMSLGSKHHGSFKKVTINSPSSSMPGYTLFDISPASVLSTKEYLEEKICITLAGRIAEEVVFGNDQASSGASQDLELIRSIAEQMVLSFGFGNKVVYSRIGDTSRDCMDQAIEMIIHDAYKRTKAFIVLNQHILVQVADALVKYQTLRREDVVKLINTSSTSNTTTS